MAPDRDLVRRGARLLAAVARRAPAGDRAAPLASLAWLSWWSGDGVRARLLVARALEDDPAYSLALLVATLVDHSVPPPWHDPAPDLVTGQSGLARVAAPGR